MNSNQLNQILTHAEQLKSNLESELLLSIPEGIILIDNNSNTRQNVAISIYKNTETSNLILSISSGKNVHLCKCYILKHQNEPIFSFTDNKNLNFTILLDPKIIQNEYLSSFEILLEHQAKQFKNQISNQISKPQTTTDKISSSIVKTSEYLDSTLTSASNYSKDYLKNYSQNYVNTTKPNEKPTEISPTLQTTLEYTQVATKYTAKGVGALAGLLATGCKNVAGKISEHVEDKYLPKHQTETGNESNMTKVAKIGGASITAIGNIWNSLENNLTEVARVGRETTVNMVDCKYGSDAGKATNNALRIATDGTKTVLYLDSFGIKAIAKKTVKETGKQTVKSQIAKRKGDEKMNDDKLSENDRDL